MAFGTQPGLSLAAKSGRAVYAFQIAHTGRNTERSLKGEAFMGWGHEHDAVRKVVVDYLEGMIWGDEERLRRAFHPAALQVGHFAETYEFFPLDEFIDWLKQEETTAPGTPYLAELLSIEVTGTVAVAKLTDTCFGTNFTDYLVMVKDRPGDAGRWQIVTKAYHVHSGRGSPPTTQ